MLVAPELPGAPEAALDLVEDQEGAGVVAELPEAGQEGGLGRGAAALALGAVGGALVARWVEW